MIFTARKFRAPAYRPQNPSIWRYFAGILAILLFPCRHNRITKPFCETQTCLDCGAYRHYRFAEIGIEIGAWQKAAL